LVSLHDSDPALNYAVVKLEGYKCTTTKCYENYHELVGIGHMEQRFAKAFGGKELDKAMSCLNRVVWSNTKYKYVMIRVRY